MHTCYKTTLLLLLVIGVLIGCPNQENSKDQPNQSIPSSPPQQPLSIGVIAEKYQHTAVYPGADGVLWTNDDLMESRRITVPVDQAVRFELRSADVIHSLFIPKARLKKDFVPGRHNTVMLAPQGLAVMDFMCTEYCGQDHSTMVGELHVVTKQDYLNHLQSLETR